MAPNQVFLHLFGGSQGSRPLNDAMIAALPGLSLAGSYLDGVAVSDALASGIRAAG